MHEVSTACAPVKDELTSLGKKLEGEQANDAETVRRLEADIMKSCRTRKS